MKLFSRGCGLLAAGVLSVAISSAQEHAWRLNGTVETYLWAGREMRGVQHRQNWEQLTLHAPTKWSAVATNLQEIDENHLDETYVQYDDGANNLRAGVLRTAFGFSDWADLFYTGIIDLPILRTEDITPDLDLYRFHSGMQMTRSQGNLQIQAALVDVHLANRQFLPDRMDRGVLRLQSVLGPWILGVSGLKQVAGSDSNDNKVYGADFRWTAPNLVLRGEAVKGESTGGGSHGFYVDAFYRPGRLTKSRLVARLEQFKAFDDPRTARHATLGLRQVLNQNFTLAVNYGVANEVPPADSMKGWKAQLLSSFHF